LPRIRRAALCAIQLYVGTYEFVGIWEFLNDPDFKPVEFDGLRKLVGLSSFTLTPKQRIEKTNAI
jgi:hypothetical protein